MVINMRKYFICLVMFLLIIGCTKKDEFSEKLEMISTQTFEEKSSYVDCDLDVQEINDNLYRYCVKIHQPKENLDDVKAFVICDQAAENIIPSYGFYENDKCNLYINKIDKDNNYYEGISLMGLSKDKTINCKLYISYQMDGVEYEEFILLRGK